MDLISNSNYSSEYASEVVVDKALDNKICQDVKNNQDTENSDYIDISLRPKSDFSLIDSYIKQPFFLEKLTIISDIEDKDYSYLIDLKEQNWISAENIKKVCFYLRLQNKFDSIKIMIKDYVHSKELILDLSSLWTFSKLKVKGLIFSKDKYKQYYLLSPGDVFDISLHSKSILKIKSRLNQEGYLNAEIVEHTNYNKHNKTVDVDLYIDKLNKFIIDQVYVSLNFKNKNLFEEHKSFKYKIERYFLSSLKGEYYNHEAVSIKVAEIKKYLITKGFWDSNISVSLEDLGIDGLESKNKDKTKIRFNVEINQEKQFIFFGNYTLETQNLLNNILFVDYLVIMPPALLKEEIEKIYKQEGFWNININIKEEGSKLFFIITEGNRIRISKITIKDQQGNSINNNLINDRLLNKLFGNIKSGLYKENTVNESLQTLVQMIIELGYWNCKIVNKTYRLLSNTILDNKSFYKDHLLPRIQEKYKDNPEYELIITLDYGELSKISRFIVEDYDELKYKLDGYSSLPIVMSSNLIKSHKNFLKNYFADQGYREINIIPKLEKNDNENTLIWRIKLDSNISKFGKTVVLGDNNINNNLILRELEYKESDIFDQSRLDRSINRLKSWGIFDQIYLLPYEYCFDGYQPLMLRFVCDDPFEVKFRGGLQYFSKNFGGYGGITYKLGSSFLYKNLTGNADLLSLSLNFTRYSRRFLAYYKRPWVYDLPVYLNTKIYSLLYEQPLFFGSSSHIYKISQDGFEFNFRHLKFNGNLDCNLGFEAIKVFDITSKVANVIEFDQFLTNKYIPYIYIEPSFFYGTFDNSLYANYITNYNTWGMTTLFTLKGLFAFKETQASFFKLLYEQSFYMPISSYLSAAFRLRLGHIISPDGIKSIIPLERFYLGGSKTVRGYEPLMVPPLNKLDVNDKSYWIPVGAKSLVNINSEIRFPIYRNVSGVLFNDMGILSNKEFVDIKNIPWEGATGVGFRYNTLLGPLRFDIGFKWRNRLKIEKNYVWYLAFGHAF